VEVLVETGVLTRVGAEPAQHELLVGGQLLPIPAVETSLGAHGLPSVPLPSTVRITLYACMSWIRIQGESRRA